MTIVKPLRFASAADWSGGELTFATADGKHPLDVAAPPEFKGRAPHAWSPEELLVTSTASCLAITIAAVARARDVEIDHLHVDGAGHVEYVPKGGFRFLAVELTVEVDAEREHPHAVRAVVEEAERRCLVSAALAVPVTVRLVVAPAAGVALSG